MLFRTDLNYSNNKPLWKSKVPLRPCLLFGQWCLIELILMTCCRFAGHRKLFPPICVLCVVIIQNQSLIYSYIVLLLSLYGHCSAFSVNARCAVGPWTNFRWLALVVSVEVKRLNFYGNVQNMVLFGRSHLVERNTHTFKDISLAQQLTGNKVRLLASIWCKALIKGFNRCRGKEF